MVWPTAQYVPESKAIGEVPVGFVGVLEITDRLRSRIVHGLMKAGGVGGGAPLSPVGGGCVLVPAPEGVLEGSEMMRQEIIAGVDLGLIRRPTRLFYKSFPLVYSLRL